MTHDDRQFIQQLFETQTQQFQRHLSAVAENFDHKIGLIAEGHTSLSQKIDHLAQRTGERFDLVDFKIDTLNEKIVGVAADLKETDARLSQKIDTVEEKLGSRIDSVCTELKVDISRVDKNITGVAKDLKAHRDDTEAHHGGYRVKEGSQGIKRLTP